MVTKKTSKSQALPMNKGKGHMVGKGTAGPQKPGVTSSEGQSGPAKKFASGGSGKMVGPQSAGPQKPGVSSHSVAGDGGKFARGGGSHMVGPQKSNPARPA